MCDSNHLPTKPTDTKMASDDLFPQKSRERWMSCDSRHIRPNPEGPALDMVANTTLGSSSDQPSCTSDLQSHQLSSSQLSFEDVENAPNWRNQLRKETEREVNHVNAESTRNLEQGPRGYETENAPNTGSTGKLEARSCTSESESRQKHVTCCVNGWTTPVESTEDNAAEDDKQNFCAYRSETDTAVDTNETETRLDVSAETKPYFRRRGSETRSRLEPCTETKTGFDKTRQTETGFADIGEKETGFDKRNSEKDRRSTSAQSKFDASAIGTVTHELLQRTLTPVSYDPQRCRILSHDLAGQILTKIIGLTPKRYKLVTFVSVGSLTDNPGVQFGSRCLWDADTDELATVRYANETLFAVVMIYGLYRE